MICALLSMCLLACLLFCVRPVQTRMPFVCCSFASSRISPTGNQQRQPKAAGRDPCLPEVPRLVPVPATALGPTGRPPPIDGPGGRPAAPTVGRGPHADGRPLRRGAGGPLRRPAARGPHPGRGPGAMAVPARRRPARRAYSPTSPDAAEVSASPAPTPFQSYFIYYFCRGVHKFGRRRQQD